MHIHFHMVKKSLLAPNNILYIFTCIQSTYNYLCDFRRSIHCAMIKVQSQSKVVGVFKLKMMHQWPTADHLDISPPSPAPPSSIVLKSTSHTHHITIDCPTNLADHAQPLISPSQSHRAKSTFHLARQWSIPIPQFYPPFASTQPSPTTFPTKQHPETFLCDLVWYRTHWITVRISAITGSTPIILDLIGMIKYKSECIFILQTSMWSFVIIKVPWNISLRPCISCLGRRSHQEIQNLKGLYR